MARMKLEKKNSRKAGKVILASSLLSLPLLPRLAAKAAEMEGERKGFRIEQFKLIARDGTRLSAAVYVPGGEGPFPAVIMIHSWALSRWQCHLYAPYFTSAGYVVLTYDCRGWGSSKGEVQCADPDHELCDLEDAIDWLLEKSGIPIKEGALGVTGISYGGGHSFLISTRDPRVKTVVPMAGWTELKESLLPRGSLKIFWGLGLLVFASWATKLNVRNVLYRWMSTLLFKRGDLQSYEDEMRRRSCLYDVEKIDKPMLIVGSWNDDLFEPNQMMEFYEKLDAPKMLYIANGLHGLDPGLGPRWAGKDIWDLTRRWFDYWLKGEENGILSEPAVRLYKPWKRRVEPEEAWPPPDVRTHVVYLGRENGCFKMSSRPKEEKGELTLKPSLLNPATSGPSVVRPQAFGIPVPGPKREAGEGYFSFTTSPAKKAFELVGIPRLQVNIVPLHGRAQINTLLYDVPPGGGLPRLITYGTVTLEDLVPGLGTAVCMDLVAVDHLLEAGHSFRLTFSGTNIPFVLPVMGAGVKVVYGGDDSTLELPLREVKAG
ncbi:MAG: CocE/NonD family hydrolase [Actinobacteria bacterium]|jgi:predicted acyl esterase|nr:MAG: CocE/NonD family hydrolase [Actinomycetota bacterium]